MKINNIKSELIREYLDSIHSTYDKICIEFDKISNSCKNPTEILHELKPTIIQEWQKMYKSFVLKPIEDDVMSLFNKIQTDEFEKSKSIIKKVQIFEVYYYTAQYFYIFVLPVGADQEFDDFPRFEIKMNENNLTLKSLFSEMMLELDIMVSYELWWEIILKDLREYDLLYDFLSYCWLTMKSKTETNITAILSEATGFGTTVFLDGSKKKYD